MNADGHDGDLLADIAALVNDHDPLDDAVSHRIALDVLGYERAMWHRSEFDPGHFTASAFVCSPDASELLLIHHGKFRRWMQPGGHFESVDVSVDGAARREIFEETGIPGLERVGTGLLRIDAHPIPAHGAEPGHVHIDLAIGFRASDRRIGNLDEVTDARWVAFDSLPSFDVDNAVMVGGTALAAIVGF